MRARIYVAGPLTNGDLQENIRKGTEAGLALIMADFAPIIPHLTCYLGGPNAELTPFNIRHEEWLDVAMPWVAVSDGLLRLPGESRGADMEVAKAKEVGIPIYNCVSEIIANPPADRNIYHSISAIEKANDKIEGFIMWPTWLRTIKDFQTHGNKEFLNLLLEMARLHLDKAADYGSDEDPLANIRASADIGIEAWKGAWLRAKDKVRRIDRYCLKETLKNESVMDSFIDLAAYSLLALVLYKEHQENQEGLEALREELPRT